MGADFTEPPSYRAAVAFILRHNGGLDEDSLRRNCFEPASAAALSAWHQSSCECLEPEFAWLSPPGAWLLVLKSTFSNVLPHQTPFGVVPKSAKKH